MSPPTSSPGDAHSSGPGVRPSSRRPDDSTDEEALLRREQVEDRLHLRVDDLAAIFAVEAVKGFGPQKFRELYQSGVTPAEVIASPSCLLTKGSRGEAFRQALAAVTDEEKRKHHMRAVRQLVRAYEHDAVILTYSSPSYPQNVLRSNNPVPVLYVKGDPSVLAETRAVACVGSRKISGRYATRHHEFAAYAAGHGFTIVSGFALGADTIGHRAAWEVGGRTLCVMPSGLDRPYPPENRDLWNSLAGYRGATMVSEFPFGMAASTLTLRKRNKTIVAASLGVLVSQSSTKGGAMNAYRFALEQHKPLATFEDDGTDETSGNMAIQAGGPSVSVFSANRANKDAWEQWLRMPSFST
jgi:DNA processing protein